MRVTVSSVLDSRGRAFLTLAVATGGHRDTFNSVGISVVARGVFTCGRGLAQNV